MRDYLNLLKDTTFTEVVISNNIAVNSISVADNGIVIADYNIINENILLYGAVSNTSIEHTT